MILLFQTISISLSLNLTHSRIDTGLLGFDHCQRFAIIAKKNIINKTKFCQIRHAIHFDFFKAVFSQLPATKLDFKINIHFPRLEFRNFIDFKFTILLIVNTLSSINSPKFLVFFNSFFKLTVFSAKTLIKVS